MGLIWTSSHRVSRIQLETKFQSHRQYKDSDILTKSSLARQMVMDTVWAIKFPKQKKTKNLPNELMSLITSLCICKNRSVTLCVCLVECPKRFLKINLVHHAVRVTLSHLSVLLFALPVLCLLCQGWETICTCWHLYLSVRKTARGLESDTCACKQRIIKIQGGVPDFIFYLDI